jgi:NAD(P)-dependent dehydrogenase (short-subunit alcohol dehydrogenase family)
MTGTATYDFEGETAIVTGSTKGIGRGIATGLAQADANVVITARTESDVENVAGELDDVGAGDVIGISADVADPEDLEALVEYAIDVLDGVNILVNNAAVWPQEESLVDASLEEWNHAMAVNLRSQFYASQLVAREMIAADDPGCIVNLTSQTGDRRTGQRGLYGISKTAINGLTWRMAGELAEHGIRMNAISTDVTESHQLRVDASEVAEERGVDTETVLAEMGEKRPLGRLGQPEDIADAVMYLASDRAAYVVGTILRVSGGGNLQ